MDRMEYRLISLLMREVKISKAFLRRMKKRLNKGCVSARAEMISIVDRISEHILRHDEEIAWGMCFTILELGSIIEVHAIAVDHQPVGVSLQLPHHAYDKAHQHKDRSEFAAWVAFAHMMHHRIR